jgi:Ser/Thr protein kinase RdoA (MazF antagonist)
LLGQLPELLDSDAEHRALLLAARPGMHPADDAPKPAAAAGRWLARLHALPAPNDDTLDLSEALALRLASTCRRAEVLGLPTDAVRRGFGNPAQFAGLPRVWCHRDYRPANWLWDEHAGLSVIDLEHTRVDAAEVDLVKLTTEHWAQRPGARQAFLDGYGPTRSGCWAAVYSLSWLHGLATLCWGHRHKDPLLIGLGERVLSLLEATPRPRY